MLCFSLLATFASNINEINFYAEILKAMMLMFGLEFFQRSDGFSVDGMSRRPGVPLACLINSPYELLGSFQTPSYTTILASP